MDRTRRQAIQELDEPNDSARLYWIGFQEYGATVVIGQNGGPSGNEAREPFEVAIRDAQQRLWILDKKFDSTSFKVLRDSIIKFSEVPDIRILSGKKSIEEIRDFIRQDNQNWGFRVHINGYETTWKTPQRQPRTLLLQVLKSNVHDRFSLIDDELWHFGGTVGAMEDEGLSAVSRGWYSHAEPFSRMFTQCLRRIS